MGKGGCINPGSSSKTVPLTNNNNHKNNNHNNTSNNEITYSQLSTKNTIDECWIAYENNVYDVTKWLAKHPGGIRSIMSAGGSDASAVMKSLHTPKTLKTYMRRVRKVGTLVQNLSETISTTEVATGKVASSTATGKNDGISTSKEDEMELKSKTKKMEAFQRREAISKDFDELNERLIKEGWYEPQPIKYIFTIIRIIAMLCTGIYLIKWSVSEDAISQYPQMASVRGVTLTFGSMLIGFYFQNVAFSGHDAGHGSISGSFSIDKVIGILIGNLFTGIDMGWWKSTHYVHHSATNSLHDDPDVQHMPLLCLEERMGDGRWSTYHGKYMVLDAIGKTLIPYQHWYFYPVLGVARINLYIQSVIYLIKTCPFIGGDHHNASTNDKSSDTNSNSDNNNNSNKNTAAGTSFIDETTGEVKERYAWPKQNTYTWIASFLSLCIFYTTMIKFFLSLGLPTGIYSFFITHIAAGLLHVQILLSHICMHYCEDGPGTTGAISAPNGHDEAGYHEWQALSTMDIDCPPWMDWFHGGLQFQLEHHIFPRVPRWNLRKLCTLTDEIYAKYDVPVVRMDFITANKVMLKHIAEVGANVVKEKTA